MRYFILTMIAISMMAVGCSKKDDPTPMPPSAQPQVEETPVEPAVPSKPPMVFSSNYIKGYNDGYDSNWLGPIHWTLSNDYRAGWSAGERDRKNGRPHKFENK